MSAPNLNYAWARALLEELVRGGASEAVVCPGSRSAPLAVTCAELAGLRTWSAIDERSAGFFALGLALATGRPTILVSTSGTAGAHFLPSIIEAAHSRVPLLVLTADRPWELQGFGAPQTIPQQRLFGGFVRCFEEVLVPEASPTAFAHLRAVASRAAATAQREPMGAVHLNVPFREPLAPTPEDFPAPAGIAASGRAGAPFLSMPPPNHAPSEEAIEAAWARLSRARRGLIACGPRARDDGVGPAVRRLGQRLGFPVLAEAASQARVGPGPEVVAHYDGILTHAPFAAAHRPDLVLRFGGGLTSKRLQQWLDGSGAEVVLFSDGGALFDPAHLASLVVEGDPGASVEALLTRLANAPEPSPESGTRAWANAWHQAERRVRAAYEKAFGGDGVLTEPRIAREVVAALPPGANLFVSSSMPVREVDAYSSPDRAELRVLSNRGANGIDGITSTALGVAAGSGRKTVLLTGDLAFLHDLGGLLIAHRHRIPMVIVVVDNDGGGIFSFLPIS
ncbi:MAG TPA: 2-succinyl-5-enolpyruvyl-6-hydroxy-3-cyclohexene-1-carboxylic-acid synthase, partial [Myxococcaceae bacterium]|nr:2-succinyl-5-enolpyruvyl-6-hydroxy-3-cyclohexene-1-carboxylic-acid synthase [Myxococcaceae bacterium]